MRLNMFVGIKKSGTFQHSSCEWAEVGRVLMA